MKKIILIALPLLFTASVVYAGFFDNFWNTEPLFGAPTQEIIYQKTILPAADSLYEFGTSTNAWLRINTDELCLTADSCKTTWPTGGGGGGTPGGSNTQIQFNNNGSFGGDANLTWSSSTQSLNIGLGNLRADTNYNYLFNTATTTALVGYDNHAFGDYALYSLVSG